MTAPSISIIVPMLDEAAGIVDTLGRLQGLGAEIIVVDGGSQDASVALARPLADRLLVAGRGRARQMNAGAAAARGDILLFLHADTRLPADALDQVRAVVSAGHPWGRFDVRILGRSRLFPLIAAAMNLRSRLTGIATGDQALFVARTTFAALDGFPDLPVMEDIALSSRLRRLWRPACLDRKVETSGRRWERHGVIRTVLLMWGLRLRYWCGADPRRLARDYGYDPPA